MEREVFLAGVRAAQQRAVLPSMKPGPLYPKERRRKTVDWFVESATAVGAVVHRAASADEVRELVREIARGTGQAVFTAWAPDQLPVPGVASYLVLAGLEEAAVSIPADDGRAAAVRALDRIGVGVTGADAAFARSGAIALFTGPGRPRMASLVPEVHVAILPEDRIVASLSAWAEITPSALDRSSNLVFIAGPSRSGDIEMTLSIGVHGPRAIHIVIV